MPRPHKPRIVCQGPVASYFKPRGIPLMALEEVVLGLDELEALRLADLEGLSQEDSGTRMGVSRGTIGRLLERAHRIVADALLGGKALRLEGGPITMPPGTCDACSAHDGPGCPGALASPALPTSASSRKSKKKTSGSKKARKAER